MNYNSIFTAFLTLFCLTTFSQDCEFYYPQTVGAELTYQQYDQKDRPNGKIYQEVVKYSPTSSGAEATIKVKSIDEKEKNTFESTLDVKCENGIFYFDMEAYINQDLMASYGEMDAKVSTENLELPSSLAVGQTLSDGSLEMDVYSSGFKLLSLKIEITDRVVEAEEKITTPAGSFDCYKIKQKIISRTPVRIEGSSYEWLCPGVGMIKSESFNSSGKTTGRSELTEIKR